MKNHVVPKVNLSAADGVYNKGLPIEVPIPTSVVTEYKNHPEWFDVVGDPFGEVKEVEEQVVEESLMDTPKEVQASPTTTTKKKATTSTKKK